jgi:hypothetical protein
MFPKMSEAAGKRITKAGDNIPSKFSSSIFFHFENAWPTTLFFCNHIVYDRISNG